MAVDAEGAEFGMFEEIVESGVWRQIKQLDVEYHWFGGEQKKWFVRHARAVSVFLERSRFVLVKRDILHHNPHDLENEFNREHFAIVIAHYLNPAFVPK